MGGGSDQVGHVPSTDPPTEQGLLVTISGQLLVGYAATAVFGSLLLLIRILVSGWHGIYGAFFCLALIVLAAYVLRDRIPIAARALLLTALPVLVGAGNITTFGLYSPAVLWAFLACVVANLFFTRRVVMGLILGQVGMIAAAGVAFTNGVLVLDFDANRMIASYDFWIGATGTTALIMLTVVWAVSSYKKSIRLLLETIRAQRDEILHQATHDTLTDLPSLRLARDRLALACLRAERERLSAAVLFIDLDGFKAANDTHGHEAGDHVLKVVAQRLRGAIRKVDTAARQGGDEFIVILDGVGRAEDAVTVAEKLRQAVAAPIPFAGMEIRVGSSIGIALFPQHGPTPFDVLRRADEAMYRVKRAGRNGHALFDPALAPPMPAE
ncbi:MAG: hypothetical protein RLY86_1049 [Pseudomonadota bacterium]|jgi:diguanylate cyclase (GGDEF)-like protein